jgi:hypothetical protein
MFWLDAKRGYFTDWATQRWVQVTGRRVSLDAVPWLAGPAGDVARIGADFFDRFAQDAGLELRHGGPGRGLLQDFSLLAGPDLDPTRIDPRVVHFYEHTADYDLDAWSEWAGAFRPFGHALAAIFSRRLQQLNVPLSALDTSRGMTSDILQLVDPGTGEVHYTAWVRRLLGTGQVLYAGAYSLAQVPGCRGACIKVVFPLPNGNAIVLMRPEHHADGSLTVVSAGRRFGDPGFYFTVHDGGGRMWARYVASLRESIHVYGAEDGAVRADHVLRIWGRTFLRLHYRLRPQRAGIPAGAT